MGDPIFFEVESATTLVEAWDYAAVRNSRLATKFLPSSLGVRAATAAPDPSWPSPPAAGDR